MREIILNNRHKKYFLLQRNHFLSDTQKNIRKLFGRYLFTNLFVFFFNPIEKLNHKLNQEFRVEFNEMFNYLPKNINNVLDIGSGLGIINIFINDNFNNDVDFTLIDKNYIEKKVSYGFDEKGQFYNDFNVTLNFLTINGIKEEKLNLINVDSKHIINKKFDLVISLLSLGYHYPINQYVEFFKKNTHRDTKFIFDIAEEYNDFNEIAKMFHSIDIIKKSFEKRHNYLRVCCVGFKK